MITGPVFLDTNVFMYAAGKTHRYKNPCLQVLRDVETHVIAAVINTECLQEILYRYSHIGLAEKGIELCQAILTYPIRILPVVEADMQMAIDLFAQYRFVGVKPRDVVHAATLQNNGITQLISSDQHFD